MLFGTSQPDWKLTLHPLDFLCCLPPGFASLESSLLSFLLFLPFILSSQVRVSLELPGSCVCPQSVTLSVEAWLLLCF